MFKVGDIVQSYYKKPWVGIEERVIVLGSHREGYYIIYTIKPKWSADGRELRKPTSRTLNEFWLYKHSGKFWEGE